MPADTSTAQSAPWLARPPLPAGPTPDGCRHFTLDPATTSPAQLGKGLNFWGRDLPGWTPRLSDIQLCVLAICRFATAILENGKQRSTNHETTEQSKDNHGIN